MVLAQICWPSAFDEGQDRDDFSVGELIPIRRHIAGWFAVAFGYTKLGDIKQEFVGMMPSVSRFVMRRRSSAAVGRGAAPIRFAFKVRAVARCTIGLIERRAALHGRLFIRNQSYYAGRNNGVAPRRHSPKQNQRVEEFPYLGQVVILWRWCWSTGKSKVRYQSFYP